jgi:tRNA threonylcarbamoyladenosine biosynthesis protein TsaE
MPILDSHTLEFFSRSPEQTRRIGMRLGSVLQSGDVVCLQGDLGAGKTTFVQGAAQGWGSLDLASSPTFIIVNIYRGADHGRLFHLDGYRLDSSPEAEELDFDSMLSEGPMLIEWPERLGPLIPSEHLWIQLTHVADEQRQMLFKSNGERYDSLLSGLQQAIFGAG